MNKNRVIEELGIEEKNLDILEYDFLKVHKEHIATINESNDYPIWYVRALMEWKGKRGFLL